MTRNIEVRSSSKTGSYDIVIGRDLLSTVGDWAANKLPYGSCRIAVISNRKVFGLYGETVLNTLRKTAFSPHFHLIGDGERFKSLKTLGSVLAFLNESRIGRTDAILALGGGVVGDIAGFAASVHLRGIPFLQVPTTLLSMVDSSVGGKTGVNTPHGKNLVGTFYNPSGVLIDSYLLNTLPRREIRAGSYEMVKHAALSGKQALIKTKSFFSEFPFADFPANAKRIEFHDKIVDLITTNVRFKAKIVALDERESAARSDSNSRKILNFGHTLAHALEKVTKYSYLRHGEAVGYGLLFAAELSKTLAFCPQKDVNLLNDVVHRVGALPSIADIAAETVFEAFASDKKNTSDSLRMILLKGIGKPVIVSDRSFDQKSSLVVLRRILKGDTYW